MFNFCTRLRRDAAKCDFVTRKNVVCRVSMSAMAHKAFNINICQPGRNIGITILIRPPHGGGNKIAFLYSLFHVMRKI